MRTWLFKMETKIDVEPFESVDLKPYSDPPTMFEEGTIGTISPGADKADRETSSKMDEETHKGGRDGSGRSWLGFLSVEYYQPYFDVTTSDVFRRVIAGMVPYPFNLSLTLSSSPDLYGPFWLCMTLIFTTAISGNLSAIFSNGDKWEFHFHEVIVIATVVYAYTWTLPVVLWLVLMWRDTSDRYSLIKIQSIYGYSMAIFIPLTLLWVINVETIRWMVLVVAVVLSGAVLVQALWIPLRNETKNITLGLLAIVFILHAGIAVGFKFYYFNSALAPTNLFEPKMEVHVTLLHNSTQSQKHNQKGSQLPDLTPPSIIDNSVPPNTPNQNEIIKSAPSNNEHPSRGSPPDAMNNNPQGLTPPDVNIPVNSRVQNPPSNSEVPPNQSKEEHLKSRETLTKDANSLTNSTASRETLARNMQKNPARDVNGTTDKTANARSTSTQHR